MLHSHVDSNQRLIVTGSFQLGFLFHPFSPAFDRRVVLRPDDLIQIDSFLNRLAILSNIYILKPYSLETPQHEVCLGLQHHPHCMSIFTDCLAEVISLNDCSLEDLHFAITALKVDPKVRRNRFVGCRRRPATQAYPYKSSLTQQNLVLHLHLLDECFLYDQLQ